MHHLEKCPACGGEIIEKEVEKLLRGGKNTAVVTVSAEVCLHCGERLYTKETILQFERIREKLACGDVSDYLPMGQSFRAAAN